MIQYFVKDYTGAPFVLFGPEHLLALGIILLINLSLIFVRKSPNQQLKDGIRYTLAGILILNEIGWHVWNIAIDQWSIQLHLPFHLCSVFVWLGAYMLITKSYPIFEFAYFLGIAGALQALLTPDAGIYGFPHFRAFQTFISHGAIISSAVFMAVVEGFRPHWASFKRVFLWTNIYLVVITGLNFLIQSNFLYSRHKPPTASLLDVLGPWPLYLLVVEFMALIMCLILYLPYMISDQRRPTASD
ncbi:MAG: TIGR02206 family membrane protein [Chloroflexi bacterium]|jgi:hypothetical integral membrane protein (TIGR02206 family)|nr:TIGR02206 family membrane protein [Chloroflexota bacterium]